MDQNQAPILDGIEDYHRSNRYGFTPPGHRQERGADPRALEVLGPGPFRSDLLATSGMDDRTSSNGYLETAQQLMAEAVHSEHAFFSTCGSSLSVKAAILAVTRGEGELLIGRDAHKSASSALMLSGLQPRWLWPEWDGELHMAHPPSPETVEAMWERHPDATAAVVVSPTPYGTCADLKAIVDICHNRGKPLIVDEAWGAHLPFHDGLPTWAMDAGADLALVSVHKMGTGFEQGSVYHLQGDLIDPIRLTQCADLLSTTSANVMIYAGIDAWRRQMVQHGQELLGAALDLTRRIRSDIEQIPGLHVLQDELLGVEASRELDPMHVLIDVTKLGISGYQAADWLRQQKQVDMGLSDSKRIEATISMADDDETAERLLEALRALGSAAPELPEPPAVYLPKPEELDAETAMLPRDAFFAPVEVVPAREAAGRISAEIITPYPPGIPAIFPGERINAPVLEYLRSGVAAGMVLPDPGDASLETVRVVR